PRQADVVQPRARSALRRRALAAPAARRARAALVQARRAALHGTERRRADGHAARTPPVDSDGRIVAYQPARIRVAAAAAPAWRAERARAGTHPFQRRAAHADPGGDLLPQSAGRARPQ